MALTSTIQSALLRHQTAIQEAMHNAFMKVQMASTDTETNNLQALYGQIQYHLGWADADFIPTRNDPGKLLRPTLLLLAYEAAGAWSITESKIYLRRALPAAAALELTHNFTLIHDDIEDGDAERRHRSTLWKLWGVPQAINSGDGLFALSRLVLWDVLAEGVAADIAVRLGTLLDRTCLVIAEGQYLDISFEGRQDISVAMYLDMIRRKTAALMACAAEMGAVLGTRDEGTIRRLRDFGDAMGVAFQVRDDLLGVWATTTESGKTPAGDVYRRKKSLPILHALENANAQDQQFLHTIYQQETPINKEQVEAVLAIFERTHTQAYCRAFLAEQCRLAYDALASVPHAANPQAAQAIEDMSIMVHFVEGTVKE
ncbi:MAG TPA: polyprenyl synthetase family protein [Ktedonobacteraceae bacterium]|nr:polyprenyl synthetase family protein [Ktedonobacteraceae bacterium]